jgi:hypothetical protein
MDFPGRDDDSFRGAGSAYEREETVAIAVVRNDDVVDWSDADHSVPALWLPESLYAALSAATLLDDLDVHRQSRLDPTQARVLSVQLAVLQRDAGDADVRTAAARVRERAEAVVESGAPLRLLIEGP